jgi:hypothetical protein
MHDFIFGIFQNLNDLLLRPSAFASLTCPPVRPSARPPVQQIYNFEPNLHGAGEPFNSQKIGTFASKHFPVGDNPENPDEFP